MKNTQMEFERQVENLIQKGYPQAANLESPEFLNYLEPLKKALGELVIPGMDLEKGRLPFVIVIKCELVAAEKAMALVERAGKPGFTKMYPHEPQDFHPIEGLNLPLGPAYLLVDINRGKETINLPPNEALKIIQKENRSPLTIEEGLAIITQYPDFLQKNNCFSLLASRCQGNQRVPAIWINGEKRPNLGWCWDGNPHTWLGSASCGGRIGA
jgi:hypothetical protein